MASRYWLLSCCSPVWAKADDNCRLRIETSAAMNRYFFMRLSILGVYNVFYDVVGGDVLGLREVAEHDAVAEDGEGHGVDVVVVRRVFAVDGGVAFGTEYEVLRGTGAGAVGYVFASVEFLVLCVLRRAGTRGGDEAYGVAHDVVGDGHAAYGLLCIKNLLRVEDLLIKYLHFSKPSTNKYFLNIFYLIIL